MLTTTVFELTFEPNQPLSFEPGQYISVVVPGAGQNGKDLRRAYSIASAPETRPIELCVKQVDSGPGTTFLGGLKPGETFRGFAPYGHFVYKPKPGRHVCFVSTGTGLAPFRSMILSRQYADAPPLSGYCLFGVRDESELLYTDDLANRPNLHWVPAISKPGPSWNGFKGRVTNYLRSLGTSDFPWLDTEYYLCGSSAMIDEVKAILQERGASKESIHREIYYKA